MDQLIPNEARLTGQVQMENVRYFFLCAQDRSLLHLSSCRSRSRNGSALQTDLSDRQVYSRSHRVFAMMSGSIFLLLGKVMVFTFFRYGCHLNIHELQGCCHDRPA